MIFLAESVIACIIFTAVVLIPLAENPIGQIMSYPLEIRKRVESLPQYKDVIKQMEKKHMVLKVVSLIVFAILFAVITYMSGATTFKTAFIYSLGLFMVVNIYDMLVMDIGIFMHCKKFWIPGTEDMLKEYHNPRHHIIGALKGTVLGVIVALLSACIVAIL